MCAGGCGTVCVWLMRCMYVCRWVWHCVCVVDEVYVCVQLCVCISGFVMIPYTRLILNLV